MADFDIIVIGSGCAGSVAAYTAASAGKSVLVVERGNYPGAKNMTGGRIYSHALKEVFPQFEEEAPLERKITHERIAFLGAASQSMLDFTSPELVREGADSYSVLRAPFDRWLAQKAEDAGAEYVCGIAVEELLFDGAHKVCGVKAGEDEITCDIAILCEGCNPLLAERFLGNPRPKPNQMAVGVKELFELPAGVIEDRFLLAPGEGTAMLFVGDCTHGSVGGGFMYTNRDTISLGIVATISDIIDSESLRSPVYQMLEDFKQHPAVAPIISDARMVEYSGHMVPEGGFAMVPRYIFDGCLIAGEAAGLCMNLGYQVRGMDFAVASGHMAAKAAVRALDAGDTSAQGLSSYRQMMEDSFVLQDLQTFQAWPQVMEGWDALFNEYPLMVEEVLNSLFCVDGIPQAPLSKRVMPAIRKQGLFKMARELRKAVKAL